MKKIFFILLLITIGIAKGYSQEPYLGEIRIFAGNFAPKGWALCNGQLLSIAQNQALFALLGTTYGGNGQTTFALPDLQGRIAIHAGTHIQGEKGGETAHTLTASELPVHTHNVLNPQVIQSAFSAVGDSINPKGNYFAKNPSRGNEFSTQSNANGGSITLPGTTISNVGGSQPHNNMMPYTVVNYIIALQGIFPSQN
jgi:Microcystin-dependent protein